MKRIFIAVTNIFFILILPICIIPWAIYVLIKKSDFIGIITGKKNIFE